MSTEYPYVIHIEGGQCWAEFPDVAGCFVCGDTPEDIADKAPGVLKAFLESLQARGIAIPPPCTPL